MTTGSRSDYAAHIGKSPAYVTKLGHQGRLVERDEGGKRVIDFDLTDRLIRNTTDLGRARNGVNAKPGSTPSLPVAPIADAGRVDAIFRQAQAQERAFNAKLAELEYRKAIGELVNAADVRASLARRAATFREALLQIPARLSAQLVAETSQAKVHALIEHELRTAMAHLVQGET